MPEKVSRIIRSAIAATLMAIAANCFLKYLWWTACYSAWYGIPKLAEQWRAAGVRASLNGWSVVVLDLLSIAVLYTVIRLRRADVPTLLRNGMRCALSLIITGTGTALFALALSRFKGSH